MNSMYPAPPASPKPIGQTILPRQNEALRSEPLAESPAAAMQVIVRRSGYGLPCAKCKTYYAADLPACPVCKTAERVSPFISDLSAVTASEPADSPVTPDETALEEERDRFLRQFKSQAYTSRLQINAAESFRCSKEENHPGEIEAAAICQGCYDRLQGRVDLMEAALHMDLKDATQVVYDAVWSDPSDAGKTYQNAAHALVTELRRRAGIAAVMGPLQPLPH
jgi:hypothetical protein